MGNEPEKRKKVTVDDLALEKLTAEIIAGLEGLNLVVTEHSISTLPDPQWKKIVIYVKRREEDTCTEEGAGPIEDNYN